MEESQKVLKEIKQLKSVVARYDSLHGNWEDLLTMIELANEENDESMVDEILEDFKAFQKRLDEVMLETLLSGPYDANNAIVTIHAGAGGTEAMDWCSMLYRMYQMWGAKKGFDVETIDFLDGEEAGLKSVTILISGFNAYGYAKCEKGVHRLVRISPFDASGRRHTSFASVEVMPEISEDIDVEINPTICGLTPTAPAGQAGRKSTRPVLPSGLRTFRRELWLPVKMSGLSIRTGKWQ